MTIINDMRMEFAAVPENEGFARLVISGFLLPLDPTMDELADVKTAVSEAVTNAILHGYGEDGTKRVTMRADYDDTGLLRVEIVDHGRGIEDVERARQPFFTTSRDGERSGMGFTLMESFMDQVIVTSAPGEGTTVRMSRRLCSRDAALPRQA